MKTQGEGMAEDEDTMRPEYDFSGGMRGVTAQRYAQGANVHVVPATKLRGESQGRLANERLQVSESKHFVEPSGEVQLEDMVREIRAARHQSWKNLRKAARALLDLPHEPFGTAKVEASSKSTVRTIQRATGMSLDRLLEVLDSM